MGLFSGIKKGLSKVWGGIKKVFKKVLGKFSKFMSSGFGKALMIVAAVFTLGTALMAGYAAWGNTAGTMMTKFIAGAKDFAFSLMGQPLQNSDAAVAARAAEAAKTAQASTTIGEQAAAGLQEIAGGAEAATQTAVEQGVTTGASGVEVGAEVAAEATAFGPQNLPVTDLSAPASDALRSQWATSSFNPAAVTNAASGVAKKESLFSKVGGGLMDFAKTPAGGSTLGGLLRGLGEGYMYQKAREDERRQIRKVDRKWERYNWDDVELGVPDAFSSGNRTGVGSGRTYQANLRLGGKG